MLSVVPCIVHWLLSSCFLDSVRALDSLSRDKYSDSFFRLNCELFLHSHFWRLCLASQMYHCSLLPSFLAPTPRHFFRATLKIRSSDVQRNCCFMLRGLHSSNHCRLSVRHLFLCAL